MTFDMVVLAAGMVPSTKTAPFPLPVSYTPEGFIIHGTLAGGSLCRGHFEEPPGCDEIQ